MMLTHVELTVDVFGLLRCCTTATFANIPRESNKLFDTITAPSGSVSRDLWQ